MQEAASIRDEHLTLHGRCEGLTRPTDIVAHLGDDFADAEQKLNLTQASGAAVAAEVVVGSTSLIISSGPSRECNLTPQGT